ncbi:Alpha beta hydrolase fold-1 [Fusarium agapanthi]|uniref:Alpha beta hydrolase fold-1 n=1 Tax=Fusarium agapanthi TaxID=1803897 RepID=A0A9P5E530_9HYPO|nr:Alpha beta hydrolase fold-1 [Fusarium agapanthi]
MILFHYLNFLSEVSSNPTIVFAPGAWHLAPCFDPIREALHSRGWTTEAVEYPSVEAEPPTKGLDDDADAVRTVLQRLADKREQIVLVVHSYGGLVGANAVKGLGYRQRKEQGLPGGVIMFVYLAAFVTPLGLSIKQMAGMLGPNAVQFHSKASHSVFLSKVDETIKGVELDAEEGKKRAT